MEILSFEEENIFKDIRNLFRVKKNKTTQQPHISHSST